MGWFSDDSYNQFQDSDAPHQAHLSHELLGGAAAFEATKMYEDHCAKNGRPDNHAFAKELLAGFAGAAVDRLAETKGADAWSAHQRNSARNHAQEQIQENFTEDVYMENNY